MPRLLLLAAEFSFFFIDVPPLIFYRILPNLPIPYLLLAALATVLFLRHDPSFDSARLFSLNGFWPNPSRLLLRDAVFLALLGLAVRFFAPQLLFSFVKRAPGFWVLVMLLYPVVSVFPQKLLYRGFFFQRYQPLFGSGWGLLLASALAFGFVHITFGNWLAIGPCALGGLISPSATSSPARFCSLALIMPSSAISSSPSVSASSSIMALASNPFRPYHFPPLMGCQTVK